MAGFGGAIKLTGANEYKQALQQITQSLKTVSTEMKATSTAFASGNKSQQETAKSIKELRTALDQQKSALSSLKNQLSQATSEYKKSEKQHKDLVSQLDKEKTKLAEIEKTLGTTSREYKDQAKVVDDLEKEVNQSEKALASEGKAMDEMRQKTANAETTVNKTTKALNDLGEEALESGSDAEKGSDGFTVLKGVLANLASQVLTKAISGLKELGKATLEAGMSFEAGMSQVSAISGATGEDLDALTQKAIEMGGKTKYSATEATQAFKYMAMAGWKTEDMLNGIEGVMNLASASGEDLATVSDIVTDALTAMGYSAQDAGHFADVLATASSNSNTNVALMGNTFQYVAPIAGALGFNIEDVATAIGLMANAGIKGEKAGTALRSTLTRLSAPPKDCAEAMEELGIAITNEDGSMKSLSTVIEILRESFAGLSESEQTQYAKAIAGQEAMSGLLSIVNASPADYEALANAIDDANGASERMANIMNDNVSGSITLLKSKIEGIMIKGFEDSKDSITQAIDKISETLDNIDWDSVTDAIGHIVEKASDLFSYIIDHGEEVKYIVAGIVGAFVAFKTVTFISTVVSAVQALFFAVQAGIPIMQALNVVMNANPIGLIITAIAGLVTAFIYLWNNCDAFREFWINLWEGIKTAFSTAWEGITTFFTETLPNVFNGVKDRISEWKDNVVGFFQAIPDKVHEMVQNVITFIQELPYNLGYIVGQALGHLIQFGADAYEWVTTKVPEIIHGIIDFFAELPAQIWQWLQDTTNKIATWAVDMAQKAKEAGKNFVENTINFIKTLPQKMWQWLLNTAMKIAQFKTDATKKAKECAKSIVDNLVNGIKELPKKFMDIGKNIVEGLWDGIKNAGNWIKDKIKEFASGILDGIKDFLGIHSPSRVFRDQVGKNIALGIGEGFESEMANVASMMESSIPTYIDTNIHGGAGAFSFDAMVNAFKEALYSVKIEMDDEEMGKFVDKTVTQLVYS